jgi:hypothetical protein
MLNFLKQNFMKKVHYYNETVNSIVITFRSRHSSVVQRWATGWMISGSSPGRGWEFFFFTTESRPALGLTQSPIQWVPGALSLGVKRPGREASRIRGAIPPLPQYYFMA